MKIPPKSITKVNRDFLIMERRSFFNPYNSGFYDTISDARIAERASILLMVYRSASDA